MSLSYFNVKKLRKQSKQPDSTQTTTETPPAPTVSSPSEEPASSPVLDEEDEKFLARLAAIAQEPEGTPPPLPTRPVAVTGNAEQKADRDLDGADTVALPLSPSEVPVEPNNKAGLGRKKSVMSSYFSSAQARFKKATDKKDKDAKGADKKATAITTKDKQQAADALHLAAESSKTDAQKEAEQEQKDLTLVLDQLNLSAVNNRVFSFSAESEELFNKFTLVLKDIVNGVPTAYNDLEKLFTEYDATLKKMYGNLPPFLQNMVKSLPAKMTAALGPELMAAQAEKPGFDAEQGFDVKQRMKAGFKGAAKKQAKARIPNLKSLLSAQGAVATMLKSILNFLKLRFPMLLTGTNVLMSLAVCLLLFVFWYCHKRGREVRLEKERQAAEEADSALGSSASSLGSDADSIFGSKNTGASNRGGAAEEDRPEPPLIISDGVDAGNDVPRATVYDMPSIKDLPPPAMAPK